MARPSAARRRSRSPSDARQKTRVASGELHGGWGMACRASLVAPGLQRTRHNHPMPHYPTRQKVRPINPHKLALSKWTAVVALNKEKHFLVTRVVPPISPDLPVEEIELQAVISGRSVVLPWRDLQDDARWHQGWV